jgi:quercetin dioxygenase-like cupin family protein
MGGRMTPATAAPAPPVSAGLDTPELRELVHDLAADPSRWRHLVRHAPDERVCIELRRDDEVEVWLICWLPGQDTGFHDHDDARAAITVVEGAVREERLSLQGAVGETYVPGDTVTVPSRAIHRVHHAGDAPAITIHAYSPPLREMGAYAPDESGELRRVVVGGRESLRA